MRELNIERIKEELSKKIKSLRYLMIPFDHYKNEIMNVLEKFDIETYYCSYFRNTEKTIIEDENIRLEIATDELFCSEIVAEITMKRLVYENFDIDIKPDIRIDVIDLLDIRIEETDDEEEEESEDYDNEEDYDDEEEIEEDYWEDDESDYDDYIEEIDDDP